MRDFYPGSAKIFKDNPTINEYVQRFRNSNLHRVHMYILTTYVLASTFKKQKILGKYITVIYLPGPFFSSIGWGLHTLFESVSDQAVIALIFCLRSMRNWLVSARGGGGTPI